MAKNERLAQACAVYDEDMKRMKTKPVPPGQKFQPGTRVRIADDLGPYFECFPSGQEAKVLYTYEHAFGYKCAHADRHVKLYALALASSPNGMIAWYDEWQLTAV